MVDEVFPQLFNIAMAVTDGEDSSTFVMSLLQNLNMIQNIKNSAIELKNYLCVDNTYKIFYFLNINYRVMESLHRKLVGKSIFRVGRFRCGSVGYWNPT